MNCRVINEVEIGKAVDDALKKSLCICYPDDVKVFSRFTYWRNVPSYRILIELDSSIIAHIAVVDRTITVGGRQILVAGIQAVFVLPQYRGKDLCDKMFSLVLDEALLRNYDLSVLFCKQVLEKYYNRFGYKTLSDREIVFTDLSSNKGLLPDKNITMWAPVRMNTFPPGDIDLNGCDW